MNAEQLQVYVDRFSRERVGMVSKPETVLIEAGAIAKFARSLGETNPLYFGLPQIRISGGLNIQMGLGWPKTVGPDGVLQPPPPALWPSSR